ncbi:MAG: 2-dehydropantoate 2-reductase [Candidatus Thiodiazotropha weberae]|uniref:2-dehydropantoate 2-reductase n=1 Tax=Candidatus Thiodiazotropha endoloripes TaxID=1818881 RepID=A0A1E2UPU2_9GAMM|nr:2-dehydropantoate 2-reductase [Candidatus Thiodiazotropha endoloripes]MCG7899498.1 2-dehydropantoate 2-reductase [Candidatus Thiodiazotropha weberae]ODB90046.1 2-dehydropantoate 2-reductase [Candidatus Thiodiazotropha endoloripes]ODB96691.1 2-dehydropantoate 2-reductase [Candidatus Thiodiazotropha endoloripes]
MRFLILGAGGIGGYYGARLQAAAHQVLYMARGEHLKALQNSGLSVRHPEFDFEAKVDAIDQQGLLDRYRADDFDLLIVTVKAGATESVMQDLKSWLSGATTPVLSLQNGIDNEIAIAAHIGSERTIGGLAVRIGGHIIRPGVIEATGVAQVVMGAWKCAKDHPGRQQELKSVADCFNRAGIPTTLSETIQKALWRKLLINNGVNPLSALTGLDTRSLTAHPVLTRTVYQLMEEVALAAEADGVDLQQCDIDEMYQLICQFDAIKTSMLVDREKGRPLELDAITGVVVERCSRLGKEAPISALVQALLENQLKYGDR